MQRLLAGIRKFRREIYPRKKTLFARLAHNQHPRALFITCSDSRVVPDLITQSEPGDLFICRNAGNMVPPYGGVAGGVSATIEYAVAALKVRHVVLCGHSQCGAMKGVLQPESVQSMPAVASWLENAAAARAVVTQNADGLGEEQLLQYMVEENVIAQLNNLQTHPSVAAAVARGELDLHAWVYDIECGAVSAFNAATRRFEVIEGENAPAAMAATILAPPNKVLA